MVGGIMLDDDPDTSILGSLTDNVFSILEGLRLDETFGTYRNRIGRSIKEDIPRDGEPSPLLTFGELLHRGYVWRLRRVAANCSRFFRRFRLSICFTVRPFCFASWHVGHSWTSRRIDPSSRLSWCLWLTLGGDGCSQIEQRYMASYLVKSGTKISVSPECQAWISRCP